MFDKYMEYVGIAPEKGRKATDGTGDARRRRNGSEI